ncbi:hypothetical protein [Brevibacillus marinus]|nr:hypothetical protein [Brevibacillus marinus]
MKIVYVTYSFLVLLMLSSVVVTVVFALRRLATSEMRLSHQLEDEQQEE